MMEYHLLESEKLVMLRDYLKLLLEDSLIKDSYQDIKHQLDKECSTPKVLTLLGMLIQMDIQMLKKRKFHALTLSIQESQQKASKMILKDKLASLGNLLKKKDLTQIIIHSSLILAQELILTKKDLTASWIFRCKGISAKLSCLTKTDYQDSDMILLKKLYPKEVVKSQLFKIQGLIHQNKNLLKTYLASYISIHVDKWENDLIEIQKLKDVKQMKKNKKKANQIKTIKIKFKPDSDQKIMLSHLSGGYNYMYNKSAAFLNSYDWNIPLSGFDIKNKLATGFTRKYSEEWNEFLKEKSTTIKEYGKESNEFKELKKSEAELKERIKPIKQISEFEETITKELRDLAVKEAYIRYTTAKATHKNFTELNFRKKKLLKNNFTINFPTAMIKLKDGNLFFTNKSLKVKQIDLNIRSKKFIASLDKLREIKISRLNGRYFLYIPIEYQIKETTNNQAVGLDPGSSTFLSGYATNGKFKIQQTNLISKLNQKADLLKSKKVKNLRKALLRIERRKKNLVDNMHWQVIKFLCDNYKYIYLEKFDSKRIIQQNNISSLTKRCLVDFSHFKFREKLLYKAESQGISVKIVPSYYTSKHCSSCGALQNLTLAERSFECSGCSVESDRDINAAKNMLMLGLTMC